MHSAEASAQAKPTDTSAEKRLAELASWKQKYKYSANLLFVTEHFSVYAQPNEHLCTKSSHIKLKILAQQTDAFRDHVDEIQTLLQGAVSTHKATCSKTGTEIISAEIYGVSQSIGTQFLVYQANAYSNDDWKPGANRMQFGNPPTEDQQICQPQQSTGQTTATNRLEQLLGARLAMSSQSNAREERRMPGTMYGYQTVLQVVSLCPNGALANAGIKLGESIQGFRVGTAIIGMYGTTESFVESVDKLLTPKVLMESEGLAWITMETVNGDMGERKITLPFDRSARDKAIAEAGARTQSLAGTGGIPIERKNISEWDRKAQVDAAVLRNKDSYGHVVMDDNAWSAIMGSKGPSDLKQYFDGKVDYIEGLHMMHFTYYVSGFNAYCARYLKPDAVIIPITKTTTTYYRYGSGAGVSTTETENIRVNKEYAAKFTTYFNELQEWEALLKNPFERERRAVVARNALEGEAFFKHFKCDSPEMHQLGSNLLRAAHKKPSIQTARERVPGVNVGKPAPKAELIYVNVTGSAIVELGYISTPRGWLPENPSSLHQKVVSLYGEKMQHHTKGTAATGVAVLVENGAATKSLQSMHVNTIVGANSHFTNWIWRDLGEKNLRDSSDFDHWYVECNYQGGGTVAFWFKTVPEEMTPSKLKAAHPQHPLLKISSPKQGCPKSFDAAEGFTI